MIPKSWLTPIKKPQPFLKKTPPSEQPQEAEVHFQIPQTPSQLPSSPPEQIVLQNQDPEPKKRKGCRTLIIIIILIVIVMGLGIYFLKG